eukprot:s1107_g9.t1
MGCGVSASGRYLPSEAGKTQASSTTSLRKYFQNHYKQGATFEHSEYQDDDGEWCWVHQGTTIKVWKDAIDLSQGRGHEAVECFFHYTSELGFRNITNTKKEDVEIFASLMIQGERATAWWGQGVYTVRKAPHEWPDAETLVDNNFRNMFARDAELHGIEAAKKEGNRWLTIDDLLQIQKDYEKFSEYYGRVAYCIPILAFASCIYDVSTRQTPEMVQQGRPPGTNLAGKLLNEPGKRNRECVVVRVEHEDEITNASAVLLETLRQRARGVQQRFGPDDLNTLGAISRLANVLKNRGLYEEATPLFERALQGREEILGPEHPDTLTAANSLALLLEARFMLAEAEPLFRRALMGRQMKLGPKHPDTLEAQGKFTEAEPLFRKALVGCEEKLGKRHPHTLTLINNLAGVLHVQGKLSEAAPLFARALEGREAELGKNHPDTLTSVNNLALLLEAQGNFQEAEPLLWRGLEGYREELGSDHPDTLAFVNNLAHLLQAQGRLQEAEALYRQGLQDCQVKLGGSHPHSLTLLTSLANLVLVQGKEESEKLLRQAMEACEANLGWQHPLTLVSVNGLALVFEAQQKLEEAEPLFRRALEGNVVHYGAEHPHSVLSLENLGRLLQRQGKLAEAESLFQKALDLREKTSGNLSETLAANNLGRVLEPEDQLSEADRLLHRALTHHSTVTGVVGPLTPEQLQLTRLVTTASTVTSLLLSQENDDENEMSLVSVNGLAFMFEAKGDFSEAEPLFWQLLKQREAKFGPNHPQTFRLRERLARQLQDQGKLQDAEPLLRQALEAREVNLGPKHVETLAAVRNLLSLLDSLGEDSESLLRRLFEGQEATLGPKDPNTLESLANLAKHLEAKGDSEAEKLFKELEVRQGSSKE